MYAERGGDYVRNCQPTGICVAVDRLKGLWEKDDALASTRATEKDALGDVQTLHRDGGRQDSMNSGTAACQAGRDHSGSSNGTGCCQQAGLLFASAEPDHDTP